jgi:hypothetical protein
MADLFRASLATGQEFGSDALKIPDKTAGLMACSNQILIKIGKRHLPLLQVLDHLPLLCRFHVPPIPDFIQCPVAAFT